MTPTADELAREYGIIRTECALVEHTTTGLLRVAGPGAARFLSETCSRSVDFLLEGQILPALLLTETGDLVAELQIHCAGDAFRIEIPQDRAGAAGERIRAATAEHPEIVVEDLPELRVIALEGPQSPRIAQQFLSLQVASMAYPSFVIEPWNGHQILISRTGVSGEYGFTFHVPAAAVDELTAVLVNTGARRVSQEALDICRLEMRFPNLAQEAPEDSATPFTVGLQWMVDFGHDFPGRTALINRVQNDAPGSLVCWRADGDSAVPAPGTPLTADGGPVGTVRHALYSPGLKCVIGVADVPAELAASGLELALGEMGARVQTISSPFRVATSLGLPLS